MSSINIDGRYIYIYLPKPKICTPQLLFIYVLCFQIYFISSLLVIPAQSGLLITRNYSIFPFLFLALFAGFRRHYSACFLMLVLSLSFAALCFGLFIRFLSCVLSCGCLSLILLLFSRPLSRFFHVQRRRLLITCLLFSSLYLFFPCTRQHTFKKRLGLFLVDVASFYLHVSYAVRWPCNFPPEMQQCDIKS